jgi:O-antigen ligase
MHNPNSAGLWGASVLIGALYLVMTVQKNKLWFAWLSVILSIVFIAVSESRTALLCACGQIFFCVIIFLKRKINSRESHRFNWTVFRRVITFALIFVVCLIVVGALTLFQNENLIPVIDHISSGRVDIWENFLGKINMWGHDFRADPTYVRIGSHNNVIDILYRNGAVAGILYLLLEIAALVRIIRCCLRKGTVPLYMYFVCSATIAFVLVSLFETVMQPTHWTMTMLFFLALAPGFQAFNQIDSPK